MYSYILVIKCDLNAGFRSMQRFACEKGE
jgi:hypothetical protein